VIRYGQKWYPKGYENEAKKAETLPGGNPEEVSVPMPPAETEAAGRHIIEETLASRRQNYDQPLFSTDIREDESFGKNTFRKVTFQGVIAKALMMGKLTQRYLVAENLKSTDRLDICVSRNGESSQRVKCSSTELDVLCKETAAYLLAGGSSGGYVMVNKTDVSNWGKSEIKNEGNYAGRLSKYFYRETAASPELPIFEVVHFDSNVSKMKVCPEWIRHCGWRLATEEELDGILQEHPECLYFRDDGGREDLSLRKRYEKETQQP